ncbi:MAG: phosphoenolpyruvate synthase [Acidiferrobacteraceae bacterium]
MTEYVVPFERLGMADTHRVGGKNASLGEMIAHLATTGVRVPGGFATTADAYREFLAGAGLSDAIAHILAGIDVKDVPGLAASGRAIRERIMEAPLPAGLEAAIRGGLVTLGGDAVAVAVRSSATAEDLPDASFAGQQQTLLNVRGADAVLSAVREVYASLFTDRAIAYRAHRGFGTGAEGLALSVGIQRMVRSDTGASGVMFTLDTESGFPGVIFVTAAYGLGETVVQGAVNPDEFYVDKRVLREGRPAILRRRLGGKKIKMILGDGVAETTRVVEVAGADRCRFALSDDDVCELGQIALKIEAHYGCAMDIEWGKDGSDGRIYVLQARPETVKSRSNRRTIERYRLHQRGRVLATGRSIGQRIGAGAARIVSDLRDIDQVGQGEVLVTDMTDPDWEPVMKRASAIVTNRGGRTCHAAIIARELGIPAVVGCGNATEVIKPGSAVTVCCAEGDEGYVYEGLISFEIEQTDLDELPELPFKIMINVGNPERAFDLQWLPNAGVGLARIEFLINRTIGIHPRAVLDYERLPGELQEKLRELSAGYGDPVAFYVAKLTEGVATLASAFWPKPVIVRLSDFKSNEYARLLGGDRYEPKEENPMIGLRGASRYISREFRDCFELECRALKCVRDRMGFTNVEIMVPFVRTVDEARAVNVLLEHNGLKRGGNGLRLIMMCEVPSNALLAEAFLEHFDGFSIGSNDMTQLTLGLDRDSGLVANLFDERDPAVKVLLHQAISACRAAGKYVGICGQGPSDHPEFARWLMAEGIDSVSLNPDSVTKTWLYLGGGTA